LKDRQEDIPLLAAHFLKKYAEEMGKPVKGFASEAMKRLMRYPWPGMSVKLENVIERSVVMSDGDMIRADHLALSPGRRKRDGRDSGPLTSEALKEIKKHLREKAVEDVERAFILSALKGIIGM